ncbi:MAG: class I SAM-dependent methyltransferase [Ignavibacteriaceae bacterium]|nr:class I SAM-dependent methyltransferase [Ignavibacteriaceae bacterium]
MLENKNHWYDGWFYDTFIAPNQDRLFSEIKNLIKPNSRILDVGCGTGRFSFFIADKCSSVVGIDLSQRNIEKAKKNLQKEINSKISFKHTDISELVKQENHYDYAVLTYVIHEVNEDERVPLLSQISQIADKILIGDYLVPRNKRFWNLLNELVEFAAGTEHYKNYKNYCHIGGIQDLARQANLKIISEIRNRPLTSHLVVLAKR